MIFRIFGVSALQARPNFNFFLQWRELYQSLYVIVMAVNDVPGSFRLLSWNIDGLDQVHLEERTSAVIATIERLVLT